MSARSELASPEARTEGIRVNADDEREVVLADELEILPDQTTDDTDAGWGEQRTPNDDRLLADRPPHWD